MYFYTELLVQNIDHNEFAIYALIGACFVLYVLIPINTSINIPKIVITWKYIII